MIVMMDMSTGKVIADEFGRFEDEVLNAEWLPPQPQLQLGLQEVCSTAPRGTHTPPFIGRMLRKHP